MSRVFDCFPIYDEMDVLDIHLHELRDVVDYFVIVEARQSFSGEPKRLHFADNRDRFAAFDDRIRHVVVDRFPPTLRRGWAMQGYQREALWRGIADAADDDVILLTDVDEIVRAEALAAFCARPARSAAIACFELRHYNYFLNWECSQRWLRSGPRAIRRKYLRSFRALRQVRGYSDHWGQEALRAADAVWLMKRPVRRLLYRDAGWHFGYLGGPDAFMRKARSFVGSEADGFPTDAYREIFMRRVIAGLSMMAGDSNALQERTIDGDFPRFVVEHQDALRPLIADDQTRARLQQMLTEEAFSPAQTAATQRP